MENNSNKWLMITAAVLAVITIGLVGYVMTNKEFSQSNNPTEKKQNKNNEEVEQELKDVDIIKNVSTKIDLLVAKDHTVEYETSKSWGAYGFRFGLLKNQLKNEFKQIIVMESLDWDNITGDAWKANPEMSAYINNALKFMPETNVFEENGQVTTEKANQKSIELFGKEITNPVASIGKCPKYIYDATSKMYFRPSPSCGGASDGWVASYKSKFTKKGQAVYAYVSFAFIQTIDNGKYKAYKDFDYLEDSLSLGRLDFKNEYETSIPVNNFETFKLDSTNYQDFSEYKFTFQKKDNDNYYFEKVEQTK